MTPVWNPEGGTPSPLYNFGHDNNFMRTVMQQQRGLTGYGADAGGMALGGMAMVASIAPILLGAAFWQLGARKHVTPWVGKVVGGSYIAIGALGILAGGAVAGVSAVR